MKKFILLSVFILTITASYSQDSSRKAPPVIFMSEKTQRHQLMVARLGDYSHFVGKPFGAFEVKNPDGKTILNNDSLKGKLVYINFWFEGCKFCHELFNPLNILYERYKNDPNVQIISFCPDPIKMIETNITKYGLLYPVYPLPWAACHSLKIDKGYPANFLLNKNGEIVYGYGGSEFLDSNYLHKQLIPRIDTLNAL